MDKEQWKNYKELAEIFIKNNTPAYIKDIQGNYYFCHILLAGEESLLVECFAPEQRVGKKIKLYYPKIVFFDEYKEEQ